MATKRRVTLSLNADLYDATREMLRQLPGKPTISGLIDDMLKAFVTGFGPMAQDLAAADPGTRVRALTQFHADSSVRLSLEFADAVRTLEQGGAEDKKSK